MKMTNEEIMDASDALEVLNNTPMNVDTRQKVRMMHRKIAPLAKDIREFICDLMVEHGGKKDALGNATMDPKSDRMADFMGAREAFLAREIDVGRIDQIAESEVWRRVKGERELIELAGAVFDKLGPLENRVSEESEQSS